jgi:hypothetical protein
MPDKKEVVIMNKKCLFAVLCAVVCFSVSGQVASKVIVAEYECSSRFGNGTLTLYHDGTCEIIFNGKNDFPDEVIQYQLSIRNHQLVISRVGPSGKQTVNEYLLIPIEGSADSYRTKLINSFVGGVAGTAFFFPPLGSKTSEGKMVKKAGKPAGTPEKPPQEKPPMEVLDEIPPDLFQWSQ